MSIKKQKSIKDEERIQDWYLEEEINQDWYIDFYLTKEEANELRRQQRKERSGK